jgi:hypothetical protein
MLKRRRRSRRDPEQLGMKYPPDAKVKKEYVRLRHEGYSAQQALRTARFIASWVGGVGDKNFLDHSGGPIYKTESGYRVDYVEPPSDDDDFESKRARWTVYQIDLDPGLGDWADLKGVASYTGVSVQTLKKRMESTNYRELAHVLVDIAGYHGWHEFDQYPLSLTRKEVEERYGDTVSG